PIPCPGTANRPRSAIASVVLSFGGPLDPPSFPTRRSSDLGNASGSFSYTPAGEGTYSFYTLATDKAGNAESPPSSADVQVTVLYDPTTPRTTANPHRGSQDDDVTDTTSPTDSGPAGGVPGV